MTTVDKIFLTIMSIAMLLALMFVSYEYGKGKQCETDKEYLWHRDFGKCMKVNRGDYK